MSGGQCRPAPRFGTDGVRGVANLDLTPEWAVALGRVAAQVLCTASPSPGGFVVGRDTRASGAMLSAALAAGIASEGVDVIDLGVITTPGVAWVAAQRGVPGAVISASHNPYTDNGVKFFAAGGTKLSDREEGSIQAGLDAGEVGGEGPTPSGRLQPGEGPPPGSDGPAPVGSVTFAPELCHGYSEHLVASLEGRRLDGLSVVVDCANGAATHIAPEVIRALGAEVVATGDRPDGHNINEKCGSTHLDHLRELVATHSCDVGLAFDGDADRCLAVDHRGGEVDGDRMIALFALDLNDRGLLGSSAVVVTHMTNLGFRLAMAGHGITTIDTDVGDRNVLVAMEREGAVLGGEQSGHVIFRSCATTGDGILTGLALLDLVARRGKPLSDLAAAVMTRLPQKLVSVQVADPGALNGAADVWAEVDRANTELGRSGRVLVRPSGTEPKVRVMVEAESEQVAEQVAERLANAVSASLGAG